MYVLITRGRPAFLCALEFPLMPPARATAGSFETDALQSELKNAPSSVRCPAALGTLVSRAHQYLPTHPLPIYFQRLTGPVYCLLTLPSCF